MGGHLWMNDSVEGFCVRCGITIGIDNGRPCTPEIAAELEIVDGPGFGVGGALGARYFF